MLFINTRTSDLQPGQAGKIQNRKSKIQNQMPIDFSSDLSPSFRDLTHTGLVLLKKPLVRSLRKIAELKKGGRQSGADVGVKIVRVRHRDSVAPF